MVVQYLRSFLQKTTSLASFFFSKPKMNQLLVRCVEGEEFMTISFSYGDKQSNLLRSKMETSDKSLSRLQNNVRKLGKSKRKPKKMKCDPAATAANDEPPPEAEIVCSLFVNDQKVGPEVFNKDAWVEGAVLHLGDFKYSIRRNMPAIISLKLPNCVLVGCPIYPRVEFEFVTPEACRYTWYREVRQELLGNPQINVGQMICLSNTADGGLSSSQSVPMETESVKEMAVQIPVVVNPSLVSQIKGYERRWVEVSSEQTYTPETSDIGGLLKLVCHPGDGIRSGNHKEVQTSYEVKMAPDVFPFERRHEYTKERTTENCFRVVSYNVLADMYADSDYSRDFLYPYCPKDALEIDYREQVLLKELSGFNADILCLQEVGKKSFENVLLPCLKMSGLDGMLCCKHGNVPEGEAIFYRTEKFRLLGSHDVAFCEELVKEPLQQSLLEVVVQSKAMLKKFLGLAAIVQVAVLELISDPSRRLCVANTHLYFHPRAAHLRLIQTAILVKHLEKVCSMYNNESDGVRPAIVLMGDLNSSPSSGVYQYLTKGSIKKDSVEWYSNGKEEFCGGAALDNPITFQDVCKGVDYTNFVASFQGKLDHIMVEGDKIELQRVIPLSSHEEVTRHIALPNAVFPSDHLALVCELGWKADR
ncbi:2',5'-phosphodiesterase 12-like [Asterias amurensis]|uniref:2',5'-phosphodiesterase 12-like n=1 Tax=Asterias amurensis TaxID=7602 RepID=UPI003AB3E265